MILTPKVDKCLLCSYAEGGNSYSFDERERIVPDKETILKGADLAFVRVADDVLLTTRCRPRKLPFCATGKPCSSPAFQLRISYLGDDRLRPHLARSGQSLESSTLQVCGYVARVNSFTVSENSSLFHVILLFPDTTLEHRRSSPVSGCHKPCRQLTWRGPGHRRRCNWSVQKRTFRRPCSDRA